MFDLFIDVLFETDFFMHREVILSLFYITRSILAKAKITLLFYFYYKKRYGNDNARDLVTTKQLYDFEMLSQLIVECLLA